MMWYEIYICSYQPSSFMVEADSYEEAIEKTLTWAIKKYPGMFIEHEGEYSLVEPGYPIIAEVNSWN